MLSSRLNRGRLNNFRLNAYRPVTRATVNGIDRSGGAGTGGVRIEGASITQLLNHEADTASFRCWGFVPVEGQSFEVVVGGVREFGGRIVDLVATYEEIPANVVYDVHCIDPTWLLGNRLVMGRYVNLSATVILADLLTRFATSALLSTAGLAPGLPVIDEITFTNEELSDAITRVMERIGGYWYVDYDRNFHAFLAEAQPAYVITQAAPRTSRDYRLSTDLSPVVTRVVGRGGGASAAIDRAVGASTLPVIEPAWYASGGGMVECGPQVLNYAGVATGNAGALLAGAVVTAPTTPSAALDPALGNLLGTYQYKVTNVIGGGESQPSGASTAVVTISITPDAVPITFGEGPTGFWPIGTVLRYRVAFITAAGDGVAGRESNAYTIVASGQSLFLGSIPLGPGGTTGRRMYRSMNGGPYKEMISAGNPVQSNNTDTGARDIGEVNTGSRVPTDAGRQVIVTFVAGPTGTTARRLYRTTGTGDAFLRLTQISDNTTTTYTDNKADGSLGDMAPSVSAIPGQVGDTVIAVQDLTPFPASGWVAVGSQLIRYTGRSGASGPGTLTGVPAAGNVGAITGPLAAGAQIAAAPHLLGIPGSGTGSILYAIKKGDAVNIRLEMQDAVAVAEQLARGRATGVIDEFFSDGRFGAVELYDHLLAILTERKDALRTVSFESRDPTLQVGMLVTFAVTTPPIAGVFRIQRIVLSEIAIAGGAHDVFPLRTVEASTRRYSFTDILRQVSRAR